MKNIYEISTFSSKTEVRKLKTMNASFGKGVWVSSINILSSPSFIIGRKYIIKNKKSENFFSLSM